MVTDSIFKNSTLFTWPLKPLIPQNDYDLDLNAYRLKNSNVLVKLVETGQDCLEQLFKIRAAKRSFAFESNTHRIRHYDSNSNQILN